jgi:hypothetical protein
LYPEPNEIIQGDTVSWIRRSVQVNSQNDNNEWETTDINASEGWALKFVAVGKLGNFSITASADTDNVDDFVFTALAATTAAYVVGDYKWQLVATKSTNRYTVADGIITVTDNIANRSALYDNRSHAKKMLDAIEAELEGRGTAATMALVSYAIAGRSKTDRVETLVKLRTLYKREYDDEIATARMQAGLGTKRKILTRFINPGS